VSDTDAICTDYDSGAIWSDDRELTHMCAINISVATSQFSYCYLYSGMR
jgi:hypothetical protein